jgi:hypothetical protein
MNRESESDVNLQNCIPVNWRNERPGGITGSWRPRSWHMSINEMANNIRNEATREEIILFYTKHLLWFRNILIFLVVTSFLNMVVMLFLPYPLQIKSLHWILTVQAFSYMVFPFLNFVHK